MARSFTSTPDQIVNGSAPLPLTGSMSFWVNPTFYPTVASPVQIFFFSQVDGNHFFGIYMQYQSPSPNTMYLGWYLNSGNNESRIASATLPTLNVWNNIVVTWDNTARGSGTGVNAYLNSSPLTTSINPLAFVSTTSDRSIGGVGSTFFAVASIAEYAVWTAVLTQNEVNALAAGGNPWRIRPGSLAEYLPLHGLLSPEPNYISGGAVGVVTGTTQANHAPVRHFRYP